MNKKLIAVAIAAAVAAPAAMANDTTLYGKVHMSINNANDQWNVQSHSSRLGVKGSEDLGNGLKAIFKYEMGYNGTDSSTAIGGARNSYIGLAGGFGTFVVGRHDTPAKVAFYAAGNERLGDSIIDLNNNFGFDELRTSNAIAYISPSFSGLTVAAAIVPGETPSSTTSTSWVDANGDSVVDAGEVTTSTSGLNNPSADGLADAYSIGVMYAGNGVKAGIGYTNGDDLVGADAELLNIGASVSIDMFSVGAQYQETSVGTRDRDSWAITGTANFGNNQLIAIYGQSDDDAVTDGDRDTFGLAIKHTMSKRTAVYAAYRNDDGKSGLSRNWIGNGGTTQVDDAFGIGMIHNF